MEIGSINAINNAGFPQNPPLYQNSSEPKNIDKTSEISDSLKGDEDKTGKSEEENNNQDSITESGLSKEELKEVDSLKKRDKEVRAHEMAHISAGAQYITKRASFEYESGPDGKRYAVGGEVGIDVSKVADDPEATIKKMQVVQRAALAPADPSSTDRAVASSAARKEAEARIELSRETFEQMDKSSGSGKYNSLSENKSKGSLLDISV